MPVQDGATFQGERLLTTGVKTFIATTSTLDDTQVARYMASTDLHTLSFNLFAFAKLGEDTYPGIVVSVGNLEGDTAAVWWCITKNVGLKWCESWKCSVVPIILARLSSAWAIMKLCQLV